METQSQPCSKGLQKLVQPFHTVNEQFNENCIADKMRFNCNIE